MNDRNNIHGNRHEISACKKLLVRILEQAILDLKKQDKYGYPAITWFNDKRDNIGSFIWICKILNMQPNITRASILNEN